MKLRYERHVQNRTGTVLTDAASERRIELFIRSNGEDTTFSLISLAGPNHGLPERNKSMGPFHSEAMARGAANAVMTALRDCGFQILNAQPIWSIQAAGEARGIRRARDAHRVDCRFVPLGVPPAKPAD